MVALSLGLLRRSRIGVLMKSLIILCAVAFATVAAANPVTVVHDKPEVAGCTFLGTVHSTFGHVLIKGAESELARKAAGMGGDTVLSHMGEFLARGDVYRCAK